MYFCTALEILCGGCTALRDTLMFMDGVVRDVHVIRQNRVVEVLCNYPLSLLGRREGMARR